MTTQQATAGIKLICHECRYENEAERIYCHECGTRLNRAAGVAKKKEVDPKLAHQRVKKMFDPGTALRRQRFFLVSKVILGALAVAGLVQMLRPPELPAAKKEMVEMPAPIALDLENAATDPRVGALRYSEEQINAYLAYSLKSKKAALSKYVDFDRLVVGFEENLVRVTTQRSYYKVPLCTTATYRASLENGQLKVTAIAGAIGRMPVHPALMKYSNIVFADVRTALERERKSVVKLGAIELHPKLIVFTPKAPQA